MPTFDCIGQLGHTKPRISRFDIFVSMARHAQGRKLDDWPGWSTGETLAIALVLDRFDVLSAMKYSAVQAMERVSDLFTPGEFVRIQREVRS